MMHKINKNEDENVFTQGIRGWKWLFGKMKGKKKEEKEESNQPKIIIQNPQGLNNNGGE
jgi:hypothetical protein